MSARTRRHEVAEDARRRRGREGRAPGGSWRWPSSTQCTASLDLEKKSRDSCRLSRLPAGGTLQASCSCVQLLWHHFELARSARAHSPARKSRSRTSLHRQPLLVPAAALAGWAPLGFSSALHMHACTARTRQRRQAMHIRDACTHGAAAAVHGRHWQHALDPHVGSQSLRLQRFAR